MSTRQGSCRRLMEMGNYISFFYRIVIGAKRADGISEINFYLMNTRNNFFFLCFTVNLNDLKLKLNYFKRFYLISTY
jgi:hypothetical protein